MNKTIRKILFPLPGVLAVTVFLLFSSVYSYAQNSEEKFLDIQEVTTESGLKAWLVEDHSLPLITFSFSFEGPGSKLENPDNQGVSQLLSNMLDEGAGDLGSQAFQKELSDHSISLGFDNGRDGFSGSLKTLSRHKEKAFALMRLAVKSPRFDEEPFYRMRDANITRIRSSLSDPEWVAARLINDTTFEGHPYALNSGGTISSLNSLTPDDLRAHWQKFAKDQLVIAAAGDITKEELSKMIDFVFGHLPETAALNTPDNFDLQNTGKITLYQKDIPQTIIQIRQNALDENHEDFFAQTLLNYIFGGAGFGSRLMEEAREARGLTYGIYSSVRNLEHVDLLSISTSTKNEKVEEMLQIIRSEMQRLKEELLSERELQDAKSYMTGSMPLALTSKDKIANLLLSMQMRNRPIDYLDHYAAKINTVSAEDIQRLAQEVFTPENLSIVLVGHPENIKADKIIEVIPNVE